MKQFFLFLFLLVCIPALAQTHADSLCWNAAQWGLTELGRKATVRTSRMQLFNSTQTVSVLSYPARRFRTFTVYASGDDAATTDTLAIRNGAKFAINGSYFDMRNLVLNVFFVMDHKLLCTMDEREPARTNGVLLQKRKRSHSFGLCSYLPETTGSIAAGHYMALGSGPILLINGEVQPFDMTLPFITSPHPRTMIGWDDRNYIYLVVVDGRFPGEAEGVSIPELAAIARLLGLRYALNLDGGGSSTLWTEATGVVNHPCDNRSYDHAGARKIPNIIAVK